MKFVKNNFLNTVLGFLFMAISLTANSAETITEALTGGKDFANVQYRYESVRNPGKLTPPKEANASTVRLRFGYETATFKSFAVLVEAETLKTLGGGNYDSKANGKTGYAVVADPEFTEINQAYLSYKELDSRTTAKWGRQRLILDNARFIGNVGWRQNEQTFDAFTVVNDWFPDAKITAGYITNVNRVFSDNALATSGAAAGNHKMKSPIINVNYKGWGIGEVVGYGYFLDYDLPAANYGNSTKTVGLRMKGSTPIGSNDLLYTAEYASQADYKNNPSPYRVHYTFLEGGVDIKSAEFKLGYEVLGSTGTKSFATPLATLHAFNGWVDMFLTTPATGLKDAYLSAGTTLYDIKFGAVYHDYHVATNSTKFGTEWNLVATKSFTKNYLLGAKYGRFNSSSSLVDTSKLWLWAEAKF